MQFTTITKQHNVSQDSRPLLVSVIVTRQTLEYAITEVMSRHSWASQWEGGGGIKIFKI